MPDQFNNSFLAPYSKEYCMYFYILMIITFVFFVIALWQSLYSLFQGKIGLGLAATLPITPFLLYFTNRLMYSMCVGSLK